MKRAGPVKTRRCRPRAGAEARDCPPVRSPCPPLCVMIYPFHGPAGGVDVTDALVGAIALVLWKLHGGNEPVNRLEAIILLERAMERHAAGSVGHTNAAPLIGFGRRGFAEIQEHGA